VSAQELREAAALMRSRAEAARFFYSELHPKVGQECPWHTEDELRLDFDEEQGPHIASWHPAVALAVADWLDRAAAEEWCCDDCKFSDDNPQNLAHDALKVARAYLGGDHA
jgi:hypothetical protein